MEHQALKENATNQNVRAKDLSLSKRTLLSSHNARYNQLQQIKSDSAFVGNFPLIIEVRVGRMLSGFVFPLLF